MLQYMALQLILNVRNRSWGYGPTMTEYGQRAHEHRKRNRQHALITSER